jgi:hypothetical protein
LAETLHSSCQIQSIRYDFTYQQVAADPGPETDVSPQPLIASPCRDTPCAADRRQWAGCIDKDGDAALNDARPAREARGACAPRQLKEMLIDLAPSAHGKENRNSMIASNLFAGRQTRPLEPTE